MEDIMKDQIENKTEKYSNCNLKIYWMILVVEWRWQEKSQ